MEIKAFMDRTDAKVYENEQIAKGSTTRIQKRQIVVDDVVKSTVFLVYYGTQDEIDNSDLLK